MELDILMQINESISEKSKRINGFFFPEYFDKYYSENKDLQIFNDEYFQDIQNGKYTDKSRKFSIKIIDSLETFIKIIDEFDYNFDNPILYRGHTNANYYNVPTVLRNNTKNENLFFHEFERKFPSELKDCRSTVEKLLFMQHYGLETRILDVTESPLIALYFACQEMIKFRTKKDANKNKWGQVVVFRLNEKNKDFRKYYSSKTVSVMSNTAVLNEQFTLNDLEREYANDGHFFDLKNAIKFKDIISNSVYVRTKQDNPRINNQQGGFFIVNANEISEINSKKKNIPSVDYIMDYVLNNKEGSELNLRELSVTNFNDKKIMTLKDINSWEIVFNKIEPYSLGNSYDIFKTDPFDLNRHLLKNKKGENVLLLIPPYCKTKILSQLEKLNITEAFVYPDIDSISYEINNKFRP